MRIKYIAFLFPVLFFCISTQNVFAISEEDQAVYEDVLKQDLTSEKIDSIYSSVLSQPIDDVAIDFLFKLYRKTIRIKPVRTDILDTIVHFSNKLNYIEGIAQAYDRKGLNYRYESKYDKSLKLHKKALGYFEQSTDTTGLMICLNNLAVVLRKLNHEQKAIQYYIRSLEIARKLNNKRSEAISLNGIGNVLLNMGQFNKALTYFKEALSIENQRENLRGINYDLSNIGEVFLNQDIYDSALYYYEKSLKVGEERNYKSDIAVDYYNLGMVYQKMGNLKRSNEYFYKSHPKFKEYHVTRYLSKSYIKLGQNFTQLGDFEKAQEYLENGLKMALEINSPENQIEAYESLSDLYVATKDYSKALSHFKSGRAIVDSVRSEETKRNIAALESLYESNLKDQEIKNISYDLKLQKSQNLLQILAILFLVLFSIIIWVLAHLRRKNNELIISQMRNDIQDYINRLEKMEQEKEQTEEGDEREIFKKNVEQFGLSERELDVLSLISQGLKNDEIAEKLFLSVSTVKTHTRNIFQKLDVRNRIEAVRMAKRI